MFPLDGPEMDVVLLVGSLHGQDVFSLHEEPYKSDCLRLLPLVKFTDKFEGLSFPHTNFWIKPHGSSRNPLFPFVKSHGDNRAPMELVEVSLGCMLSVDTVEPLFPGFGVHNYTENGSRKQDLVIAHIEHVLSTL